MPDMPEYDRMAAVALLAAVAFISTIVEANAIGHLIAMIMALAGAG